MRTEEELNAAFLNGELSEDEQEKYLLGESLEGDTKPEAPPAPEPKAEEEPVAKPEEKEQEPIVLAKDGKHVMPFSVVEDLRENLAALKRENEQVRQAFDEQKGLLEKLTQAGKEDAASGTTEATEGILKMWEEDYPGITGALVKLFIDPLKSEIEPIKAEIQPLKADRAAKKVSDEETAARAAFDKSVTDLEPTYPQVVQNQKFWEWFDKQPAFVKAAQTSTDPAVVADVIKLYNKELPLAGDKAVVDKVKEAIEKAQSKSTVQSLSDVPGGQSPASDEKEAFGRLSQSEQLDRMLKMNPDDISKLLDRIV